VCVIVVHHCSKEIEMGYKNTVEGLTGREIRRETDYATYNIGLGIKSYYNACNAYYPERGELLRSKIPYKSFGNELRKREREIGNKGIFVQ